MQISMHNTVGMNSDPHTQTTGTRVVTLNLKSNDCDKLVRDEITLFFNSSLSNHDIRKMFSALSHKIDEAFPGIA